MERRTREILFRGRKTGGTEWVKGLIVSLCRNTMYVLRELSTGEDWCVDDKTVGQYTGLTDKNGKKIFEGDIVAIDHTRRTTFWSEIPETYRPRNSYSVHWDDEKDEINYKRNYAVEWKKKDARWILRNGSDQHDLRDVFIHFHNGIIIGNIHDNPELIKGGVNI